MLRIAKLDRFDMINNPGEDKASFTIWFSGCSMNCKNCYNPELQSKDKGDEYNVKSILFTISNECNKHDMNTVVLLGGEPLEQDHSDIVTLLDRLHRDKYNVWLYTGHEFEDIPDDIKEYLYTIKCGPYIEELSCDGFPSSTNQRIYRKVSGKWEQITI